MVLFSLILTSEMDCIVQLKVTDSGLSLGVISLVDLRAQSSSANRMNLSRAKIGKGGPESNDGHHLFGSV